LTPRFEAAQCIDITIKSGIGVDQGFEHGRARSFALNPPAYDPRYHFDMAIEAGCNAYATPLGFMEAGVRDYLGDVPLILKLSDADTLLDEKDPNQALTGSVRDALLLGCSAIGFTIYPGSAHQLEMFGQIREIAEEAKRSGLAVVIWSYPRGSGLSKAGETAVDVCGYAARIAAQLGAHIIKVKLPTEHIEQDAARKVYEEQKIPIATQAERVRHVVQCARSSAKEPGPEDDWRGDGHLRRDPGLSMSIIIAPSILVWIHADVMDGRFSDVAVQEAP
jgi:class I fructose-bisphosphate aldolase